MRDRPARAGLLSRAEGDALLRRYAREHRAALRPLTEVITAAGPGREVDIPLVRLHLASR